MKNISTLRQIQELYKYENINIIQYLKEARKDSEVTVEDIMISYDFQAGSYIKDYQEAPEEKDKFLSRLIDIINGLPGRKQSVFEAGMGEGTSLFPLIRRMGGVSGGGVDVSWSRIKMAHNFSLKFFPTEAGASKIAVGNMFSLPLSNSSVDIVLTVHSMEPNGGHEEELLRELYRVTNEYLILLEPAYELANEQARKRMEEHGYIRHLYRKAKYLGYDVLMWELYGISTNPLNPTGIMIIRKDHTVDCNPCFEFACPVTKMPLKIKGNCYYSDEALLAYPIINGIPCLMEENAVIATKLLNFL